MAEGYNKNLIDKNVIPDQGMYWKITRLNILIIETSSCEQIEQAWPRTKLLESIALKTNNIRRLRRAKKA